VENEGYTVRVYSYKFWAENKLDSYVRNKLDWIAQYSDNCTYSGSFTGWQYTSSGTVNGISGDVDISVWLNR
jgi:GH25 family lysozyme M1 (1,4-beta-N-acetylmuramidase)